MREILFRGKQEYKNKEWAFGSLHSEYGETDKNGQRKIDYRILGMRGECDYVLPETVGQFTGLTDKNGKKIFDGDIVRILGNQDVEDWKNVDYTALIAFIDGGFCAIDGTIEEHGFRRYALARMDFDMEVIGNIHDNPELLEAEDVKTENR
jgi:uncharacterized phage protein (TIGR01671 family)